MVPSRLLQNPSNLPAAQSIVEILDTLDVTIYGDSQRYMKI